MDIEEIKKIILTELISDLKTISKKISEIKEEEYYKLTPRLFELLKQKKFVEKLNDYYLVKYINVLNSNELKDIELTEDKINDLFELKERLVTEKMDDYSINLPLSSNIKQYEEEFIIDTNNSAINIRSILNNKRDKIDLYLKQLENLKKDFNFKIDNNFVEGCENLIERIKNDEAMSFRELMPLFYIYEYDKNHHEKKVELMIRIYGYEKNIKKLGILSTNRNKENMEFYKKRILTIENVLIKDLFRYIRETEIVLNIPEENNSLSEKIKNINSRIDSINNDFKDLRVKVITYRNDFDIKTKIINDALRKIDTNLNLSILQIDTISNYDLFEIYYKNKIYTLIKPYILENENKERKP